MPSDRNPSGEGFSNPYENTTLVGNWLEDRLQQRIVQKGRGGVGTTWCAQGVFEDPAVTRARDPAEAQAALLRSTYQVDYRNRPGVAQRTGSSGGMDCSGAASTLMLGTQHNAHAVGSGSTFSTAKGDGVDKVLLFSVDPVADPTAPLPLSTKAGTYGAFYHCRNADRLANGSSSSSHVNGALYADSATSPATSSPANKADGRVTAPPGDADSNLYDSVSRTAAAPSSTFGATRAPIQRSANPDTTSSLPPVPQRRKLSNGTATTSTLGHTRWTLTSICASVAAGGFGAASGRSSQRHPRQSKDGMDDERWCSSKQIADMPVEHFTLQRRLPPVRL
ncbi:hypothetical protein, conserved [Leishmania lindenbergi]|uniref:Uncharacterized protein n=1 Tax=Leishmania lindenbergi TaxID=651832 RepID=A0AAW3AW71_9TRYP